MSDAIQLPKKQFHGIWIVASAIVIRDSKRAPEINQAAAFERWQTRGVKVMHGGLGRMGANLVRRLMRDGITRRPSILSALTFLGEAASEVCPRNNDIALICRKLQRLGARQIGSWLFDLAAVALSGDPDLKSYSGLVEDSGEGRWMMMAARENRSVWGINTTFCRAGGDL